MKMGMIPPIHFVVHVSDTRIGQMINMRVSIEQPVLPATKESPLIADPIFFSPFALNGVGVGSFSGYQRD